MSFARVLSPGAIRRSGGQAIVLIGVVIFLLALVAALAAVVLLDIRRQGWASWIDVLREWQSTLGTVIGFIGAAAVLVLGTAIQNNADQARAAATSHAIGMGLALEAERLANPLQTGLLIGNGIDLEGSDIVSQCLQLPKTMKEILIGSTPVYQALLGNMVDFGDSNLAIFIRFFSFYEDFRYNLDRIDEPTCQAYPADQVRYILSQLRGGLSFYEIIARNYDVTPIIDPAKIIANANAAKAP